MFTRLYFLLFIYTKQMIVFIRHAQTVLDPNIPASQWRLSEEAYKSCYDLAGSLFRVKLQRIITSTEFKAKETGRTIAEVLQIPCEEAMNLHEHERKTVSFMDKETFQQSIQTFFSKPDELVFGQETARQTLQRFDQAVKNVVQRYSKPVAIVTHASVLSLFIAHYNALDAYTFWQGLKMPDMVTTDMNFKRLQRL